MLQRHFQQYFSYIIQSVLLVKKTCEPGENQVTPKVTDKVHHRMYRVQLTREEFKLTMLVMIGTDCIGS